MYLNITIMTGKLLIQYMKKAKYKKKDVHSTRTGSKYTKMLLVIISG